jgi:nitronate monooxygenase
MAPLRTAAEAAGSSDFSPLWAGQNAANARSASAADITQDFAAAWLQ